MKRPLILTAAERPVDPEPGIYRDIPFEEYLTWNCFSKSMVSAALRSGEHLMDYIHGRRRSAAMALGSLVDCLVLEPHLFDAQYVIQPATYMTEHTKGRGAEKTTEKVEKPWNLNSLVCKQVAADIAASGKIIVSEGDLSKAGAIRKALMAHGEAAVAITEGEKQVSFVWVDEVTGIKCKGRADLVGKKTIDDLKTAQDASPAEFGRAIGRFGYHIQAAAYTHAWEQLTGEDRGFRFVVAETGDLPAVALYELNSTSIAAGLCVFRRAMANIAIWQERGVEGYSPWWEPISAPRWMVDRELSTEVE